MDLIAGPLSEYLHPGAVIDSDARAVRARSAGLSGEHPSPVGFARAAYEWVRDEIAHSVDAHDPTVTLTAGEVLAARVGLCFGKCHLLAALLRANGIPAGLCYQRLRDGDRFVLHGLTAVHLDGDWRRLDPRGNRPGLDAQFSLGPERLAWRADTAAGEVDFPWIHVDPPPEVVSALRGATDVLALCDGGLPGDLAEPAPAPESALSDAPAARAP